MYLAQLRIRWYKQSRAGRRAGLDEIYLSLSAYTRQTPFRLVCASPAITHRTAASSSMEHANSSSDVEESSNGGMLGDSMFHASQTRNMSADESASLARKLYNEGRPVFTREMFEDAQRQIDELKSGPAPHFTMLSVIGMDGKRYPNPWGTCVIDDEGDV
ncbi:hypothetical protein JDV02_008474 [Purpureocillium takamizusanense]|uniref:Uncharacterized protein n=1 Tax=Purpureocillium takamizusanense TaxID=2060973 RepID=A0A9Q8QNS3_9HYPO|nr:uncharacterized protein JDV02_008474 [Purpureocillium takamizusanense]UNI22602.1 hypothetical protein JDV02_008474 [Purpureocillium takamizusanense]